MSQELLFLLITILAFGAVAIGVFAIGQFIAVQIRVHQRVAAQGRDVETAPGLASGFDALVSTFFDEKRLATPVLRIGWPDQFIEHGTNVEDLRRKHGLTVENIVSKVKGEFAGAPAASLLLSTVA